MAMENYPIQPNRNFANNLINKASIMKINRLGIIGFGEVGKIMAQGLAPFVNSVSAWDIKFADEKTAEHERQTAQQLGVHACQSLQQLTAQSDLIISAVTASNTFDVAQNTAQSMTPDTVFLDLNSASPSTKQQASNVINSAGGRYVEAGVMTSVPPYGIRVPILLGGQSASQLAAILLQWGMDCKVVSDQIGVASAIKMCRSVMIKGLEALAIESYSTARQYGVEDFMIPTLQETFPSIDWQQQGTYFFSRVALHGKRRAEEMRECANTVQEAGFMPIMASAIAQKHDWFAQLAKQGVFDNLPKNATWHDYADAMIAHHKA